MAVTPFKFPPLSRMPKNVEIPKRLGVRAVVEDSSNNFILTLQFILNPDLSLTFGKMQVIKYYSRFSRFLLLRQDYTTSEFNNQSFLQSMQLILYKSKSCLLFSSAEMFKKPVWQTLCTQIRLLL